MVQLLFKMNIKSANGNEKLLSVIKNPVTQYFPTKCKKIGTSVNSKALVNLDDFVAQSVDKNGPAVFVIGAMAHGKVDAPYVDTEVAVSEYPLSAAIVCTKVCSAFEKLWSVL
jgi:rRNA small subunit pseudouridine methyltransferase Nep1